MRVKASQQGLQQIQQARTDQGFGWNADYLAGGNDTVLVKASQFLIGDDTWEPTDYYDQRTYAPGISAPTWRRFLEGKQRIERDAFRAFCYVLGVNWEDVVDPTSNAQLQKRLEKTQQYENFWVGRESLVGQLVARLKADCRILVLVGMTGIGKTALGYQLAKHLPDLQRERPIEFEDTQTLDFASHAADWLFRWGETVTASDRSDPGGLLYRVLERLVHYPCLLQLDSLELLLEGNEVEGWNAFRDRWWVHFFERLLAEPECKSRLLLTSQDLPLWFKELRQPSIQQFPVTQGITVELPPEEPVYLTRWDFQVVTGLDQREQLRLFHQLGLDVHPETPGRPLLERMGAAYEGHPLALRIIAGEIKSAPFNGDTLTYWQQYRREIEAVEKAIQQPEVQSKQDRFRLYQYKNLREAVQKRVERTFQRLNDTSHEAYILLCMGSAYRRPVPEHAWFKLIPERWEAVYLTDLMDLLQDRYLVETTEPDYTNDRFCVRQHNLIRSIALSHLRQLKFKQEPV